MLKRLLLAFVALLMLPTAAAAETLEGSWALRIDGTTIFRFDLRQTGEGEWQGVWTRPRTFHTNGAVFSSLDGRAAVTSRDGRAQGDAVRLTFDDPRPRSLPDTFRFRVTGAGTAEFAYVEAGFAPFPLVRVVQDAAIGPFVEGRLYDRDNAQTEQAQLAEPVLPAPLPAPAPQPQQELPAITTSAQAPRPQPGQEPPARVAPARRVPPQPPTPARIAPTPAASSSHAGAWQPDPSVSAAIAARAAALDGLAAPAAPEPKVEPELPAAEPAPLRPAPSAPQSGVWRPDPSISAAIAARAAALNGVTDPAAEEPEAEAEKPASRVGADFLEGI